MSVSLRRVLDFLQGEEYEVVGEHDLDIGRVYPVTEAAQGDLSFCTYAGERALEVIKSSNASVIICGRGVKPDQTEIPGKTLVLVDNPRLTFMRIFQEFFAPPLKDGVHATARIGRDCVIGKGVYIGEYAVIGNSVRIGEHSQIHPGVCIYDNVRIGKDVIVHSGTVIGADGFAYERDNKGEWQKFPHVGGVILEDGVHVGANTCIDRGTMTDTVIGKGTKIDNLVHIAHNVQIGQNCIIVALSLLGGSTIVGDNSWVAPCACIRDGLSIGKSATVGMGAVVTKDVGDEAVVYGVPARPKTETR